MVGAVEEAPTVNQGGLGVAQRRQSSLSDVRPHAGFDSCTIGFVVEGDAVGDAATEHVLALFEAMRTARAIRRYRPDPVPDELIDELIRAASWAPSGGNLQPWRVILVTDQDVLDELGPLWRSSWYEFSASTPSDVPPGSPVEDYVIRQVPAATTLAERIERTPAIAIFCHYPKLIGRPDAHLDRPSVTGGASLYPAVQNFLLACRAHGLGAVLTTTLTLVEADLHRVLGIPDDVGVHAAVPFGYPDRATHGPVRRRPTTELAFANRWKQSWPPDAGSRR